VFKRARVLILEDGEPRLVAKDLAAELKYSKTADMLRFIDEDYRLKLGGAESAPSGFNKATRYFYVINRHGVNQIIFKADKKFRKWIFEEVVPEAAKPNTAGLPASQGFGGSGIVCGRLSR